MISNTHPLYIEIEDYVNEHMIKLLDDNFIESHSRCTMLLCEAIINNPATIESFDNVLQVYSKIYKAKECLEWVLKTITKPFRYGRREGDVIKVIERVDRILNQ